MLSKANSAIQVAEKAVNEAILTLYTQKDAVNIYASHYQSYRNAISATEQTIAANAIEIQAIHSDLSWERSLRQKLMNFLIPFLSTLAGKTSAATVLLEFSGTLDALQPVLDDIVVTLRPLIVNSSNYQLLISATLPTIIDNLEEANRRVKETEASKISVFQDFI
ncbi:hypothetical protein NDU88_000559 [Pleurodeles waltl]|uniref:Uncharacterized protein n=1 Tax=Pleurodeles waltl TaxID=8319 RepID=A0AAV7WIW9_PLEWA|nr:hypothetical protein NDU88_000559 [Pleurodeles waltl]